MWILRTIERKRSMEIVVNIEEHKLGELTEAQQQLVEQSRQASKQSYAPYSEFHVGCAVSHADGRVILGSNQENASFPSGLCAERVALFESAKNLATNKVLEVAVYATSTKYEVPKMLVPCAGGLQVMSDLQTRQKAPIKVYMWDGGEVVYSAADIGQFLPFHFELVRSK